jgi:hypothetical protein
MKNLLLISLVVLLTSCGVQKKYFYKGKDMTRKEFNKVVKKDVDEFVKTLSEEELTLMSEVVIKTQE